MPLSPYIQITGPSRALSPDVWYYGTLVQVSNATRVIMASAKPKAARESRSRPTEVVRVQTGVRIETRLLKVLKALAEYKSMTLGDLLEGIVLHALEGKTPFSRQTLRKIEELKGIYDLDLGARASHRLEEKA